MKPLFLILCSNGMRPFLRAGIALGLLSIASYMLLGFLLYRAAPPFPRESFRRLPIRTRFFILLPLTKGWQDEVAPGHIEAIRKYRRIALTLQLAFYSIFAIEFGYYVILGHWLFVMVASGQCQG